MDPFKGVTTTLNADKGVGMVSVLVLRRIPPTLVPGVLTAFVSENDAVATRGAAYPAVKLYKDNIVVIAAARVCFGAFLLRARVVIMNRRRNSSGRFTHNRHVVSMQRHVSEEAKDGLLSFACISDVPRRQRARRSVIGGILFSLCASLAYTATMWAVSTDVHVPVSSVLLHRVDGAFTQFVLDQRSIQHPGCPEHAEPAVFQSVNNGGACVVSTCVPLHSNATVRTLVALAYTVNGAETCTLHMNDVPLRPSNQKRSSRASTFALIVLSCFLTPALVASMYHYEQEEITEMRQAAYNSRRFQAANTPQAPTSRSVGARHQQDAPPLEHPAWKT